jgi:hypothetical protein
LPSLLKVGGYRIFFWSNENDEPLHVHVSKGKPSPNATKIWLTSKGRCIVANNNGKISKTDLLELMEIISVHFFVICNEWKNHFVVDSIKFYC